MSADIPGVTDGEVLSIPITLIDDGRRLRNVNAAQVAALVESIGEVGLLSPILVYRRDVIRNNIAVPGYGLVCGMHRLHACRQLGLAEVLGIVTDLPDLQRQMAECDENLCGTQLSKAERAMFTRRRKDIYIALHPETRATKDGGPGRAKATRGQVGHDTPAERFTTDTAKKTGQSERKVRRDAERGEKIAHEALNLVAGTPLDQGVYLDDLKKVPAREQVAAVNRDLAAAAKPKRRRRRRQQPAVRQDPTVQMALDIIDFLCRVPADKYTPAEATEITDPTMVAAVDRYFERAIPWVANFADCWRERGGDEVDPSGGAAADMISGIVGHIWAAKHERPEMPVSEIKAALHYIIKLIGQGLFGADDRTAATTARSPRATGLIEPGPLQ